MRKLFQRKLNNIYCFLKNCIFGERGGTNYTSAHDCTCMIFLWPDGFQSGRTNRKSFGIKISLPSTRFVFIWQMIVLIITNSQSLVWPNTVYENTIILSTKNYYQRSFVFTVVQSDLFLSFVFTFFDLINHNRMIESPE